jgi:hypothetical protein
MTEFRVGAIHEAAVLYLRGEASPTEGTSRLCASRQDITPCILEEDRLSDRRHRRKREIRIAPRDTKLVSVD